MNSQPFAALNAAIAEASTVSELSALAMGIASAQTMLAAKLATPEGDGLLTIEEGCAIAKVRARTLRSWSRGKDWRVKPDGTNTLRLRESSFRRWLERKRAPKPRRVAPRPRKARGRD